MSHGRLDLEPTKETVLEEYAELLAYGVADIDAARRLGVPLERIKTWLQSDLEVERRRRRRCDRSVV